MNSRIRRKGGNIVAKTSLDQILPQWETLLIESLEKHGIAPEDAKRLINENKEKLKEITSIDDEKIKEASKIRKDIENLTLDIISLRYRVNENSKILSGENSFENNNETSRIGHKLRDRQVKDDDTFHLFIDDLHKYIVQSGKLDNLQKQHPIIKETIELISIYRNYYDHIYDMKNQGNGTKKAYKKLREYNEKLLGHSIIRPDDYPILQKKILDKVYEMLEIIDKNLEEWLV